ncbi:MAG TPA: VTT domain-containing protein [Bacillota bacterium]|nr:VTT domain-containing protein [Bacillota bacterium]
MSDIFLPVPSSLVMICNGAVFGLLFGTILSLLGGMGSVLLGFALGRRGSPLLSRNATAGEHSRAKALVSRWGAAAIIVTRPIPILAESVIIMAAMSSMGWRPMTFAALIGLLPIALLYAATGAYAASIGNGVIAFALSLGMAGIFWGFSLYLKRKK